MISPNFTVDDIIEVRRQIDEETKGMSLPEFLAYIHRGAVECQRLMEARWAETDAKEAEEDGH